MPTHVTALVVTHAAGNPLVRAVEFESRMTAVVEFGGLPAQNRVASGTSLFVARGTELAAVHVGVAPGAILGGAMKGDVALTVLRRLVRQRLVLRRLVASEAVHRGMTSEQLECRLVVIEASALFPGDQGVAAFTARGDCELSVGIVVAIGAVGRRRMISCILATRGMAAGAWHGDMRAFEGEGGLVVSG